MRRKICFFEITEQQLRTGCFPRGRTEGRRSPLPSLLLIYLLSIDASYLLLQHKYFSNTSTSLDFQDFLNNLLRQYIRFQLGIYSGRILQELTQIVDRLQKSRFEDSLSLPSPSSHKQIFQTSETNITMTSQVRESTHKWTSFEKHILLCLVVKGVHINGTLRVPEDGPDQLSTANKKMKSGARKRARKRVVVPKRQAYLDVATKLNEYRNSSSFDEDIDFEEVRMKSLHKELH